jgi:hypothetical protein
MQPNTLVRWIARVWGVASFLLLLAFFAGGAESMRPTSGQVVGLVFFPIAVMAGFVIAWWREGIGGLVTVAGLALFYLWMFYKDGRWPSGPYFLLFAAPGFVHLANALWEQSRKTAGKADSPPTETAE